MDTLTIALIVGGFIFLIFVIWFFSTWNRLVRLEENANNCLLYTSPSPRDYAASRMPSSA